MSKKTRKKSSKAPVKAKAARKGAAVPKTAAAGARKPAAAKSGRTAAKSAKANTKAADATARPAARKADSKPSKAASASAKLPPASKAPSGLAEGGRAPAFQLPRDGGGTVSLADYAGKAVVLFFYPRADTPGCTREAIDFTRLQGKFAAAGAVVLGVSGDSPKAQDKFKNKHKLATPLISDEQHAMLEAYGAWGEKSMYGKTFLGIIRTTVLVGPDGRIARTWRHVKVDGHADEVLVAAQNLRG